MALTYDDIHQLIKEPSSKARSHIASKVAESYGDGSLTSRGHQIAIDIFRLLLRDTVKHVRKALAEALKDVPDAPHDIILSLAYDDYDIARDILLYSEALTDADLLELIQADSSVRTMVTIASRQQVSERVSHALVETKHEDVVETLLENEGAEIRESTYEHILYNFIGKDSIIQTLARRGDLSFTLSEKLYALASSRLQQCITRRQLLPSGVTNKTMSDIHESAILQFLTAWMTDADIIKLVEQMHKHRRLSNSLIFRALCKGELSFFEAAMAKRNGIALANTRKLLRNSGDSGFYAIYRSSGLPPLYSEAVRIVLKATYELCVKNLPAHTGQGERLAARLRASNYHQSVDGMNYLLDMAEQPTRIRDAA